MVTALSHNPFNPGMSAPPKIFSVAPIQTPRFGSTTDSTRFGNATSVPPAADKEIREWALKGAQILRHCEAVIENHGVFSKGTLAHSGDAFFRYVFPPVLELFIFTLPVIGWPYVMLATGTTLATNTLRKFSMHKEADWVAKPMDWMDKKRHALCGKVADKCRHLAGKKLSVSAVELPASENLTVQWLHEQVNRFFKTVHTHGKLPPILNNTVEKGRKHVEKFLKPHYAKDLSKVFTDNPKLAEGLRMFSNKSRSVQSTLTKEFLARGIGKFILVGGLLAGAGILGGGAILGFATKLIPKSLKKKWGLAS